MTTANNEVLFGASSIAAALGLPRRKIYALVSTGQIPVIRIGSGVAIRKSRLTEWLVSLEKQAA